MSDGEQTGIADFDPDDLEANPDTENWEERTLSDVFEVNDYPSLEKDVEQTHVGMKQVAENVRKVQGTLEKEYSYSKPRFENGDTLFARITPCLENGKTAFVDVLDDGEAATGSTEFLILSATEDVLPKFVYYTMRRPDVRQFAIKRMTGSSGRQRVPTDVFDNLTIKVPPLEEQERIVGFLDAIDSKIELNRQIASECREACRTVFRGMFGDEVSFLRGEKKSGVEVRTFGEISENFDSERIPLSQSEREDREGKYPYYGATGILNRIDDWQFDGKYLLIAEDGTVETDEGYPYLQFLNKRFWPSNHAHVVQGSGPVSTEYLRWALSEVKIDPFLTGSVQPKLSQTNLNSIEIPVPDEGQIEKFTSTVMPLHQRIWHTDRENQNLTELRDRLLPKLLSEEIRLPKDDLNETTPPA